ncbi:hypothetical protein EV356DRAFT_92919 [Viridothelium virens]|uniref:Zn(2)-C6 fungal-type domain-containing protein n=1 Tax=Viridothelium virens TaxID=1048519 RepID=A0A6A6HDS0_VIRVR|nr:hypothetical protein EV356DRAFT_92919 [Viridothelium virens]
MFATLRCTKDNFFVKNSQYQTPGTAFRPRNLACKNCREKKLRCSRQKDGCNACKENNIQCIYNKQASRRRSKRRAQSPKALTDTARSQSPAGARNLSNETQQLLGASMDTASSMIEDDARNDDAIISISLSTTSEHVDPLEDPHSVFPESDPFPEEQTRPIRPRLDFESISTDTADQILCDSHDILNGASDDTGIGRTEISMQMFY